MSRSFLHAAVRHLTRPSRRRYELLEEQNLRLQAQVARETKRRVQSFDKLQDLRFTALTVVEVRGSLRYEPDQDLAQAIASLDALLPTDSARR
jgi:hypothetical protein